MSDGKILQENEENIIPITHETCVLDDEGNPITETIGDVSLLNTESKNLVGAINEVFGDTIKEQVVNILIEKGIEASTNERWASLLNKLEEGFSASGGLDIISATELPATGRDNQICVVTDNPVDKFRISPIITDKINDNSEIFMLNRDESESVIYEVGDNIINKYYVARFYQGYDIKPSYIYQNNTWTEFTSPAIVCLSGSYINTNTFGNPKTNTYIKYDSTGLNFLSSSNKAYVAGFDKAIDLSLFKTIKLSCYTDKPVAATFNIIVGVYGYCNGLHQTSALNPSSFFSAYQTYSVSIGELSSTDIKCIEFDVSGLTGNGYFHIAYNSNDTLNTTCTNLHFTNIEFIYR